MSSHRLASGGLIDRAQPLSFSFDGQAYSGFAGDTLASALIANGVKLVGRSFKYHRPRGILTSGSEEPNALVELRTGARREPNTRATTAELYDGLVATSQNRWPSLAFDVGEINNALARFLPAGFYYKTFMWPAKFWEAVYEPLIRRAAGLGRAAGAEDPDHYEKAFAHCDVLVIGAGPAGLMAALAAGRAGARVILADEDFRLGGRLLAERTEIDGKPGVEWAAQVEAELAALPDVRIMRRTTVTSVFDHGQYAAIERVNDHVLLPPEHEPRQRHWKIVAKRAVLAAGAHERTIAFGNNDRPGVMLASAVRTAINRYAATPGRRIAVFTNNDDGWRTAADAHAAGIEIAAVIDSRAEPPGEFSALGIRTITGARVSHVHGRLGVEAIDVVENGRTTKNRMRCARGVRRLESRRASDLSSRRQAGVDRGDRRVHARHNPARHARRRRGERRADARPMSHRRHGGGRDGGGRVRLPDGLDHAAARGRRAGGDCAALAREGKPRQGLRRFPERRDGERHRARRPRGLQRGRAPQALHHARHGDRPGQDRERQRACDPRRALRPQHSAGRHHDLPAALRAGELRRDGRPSSRPRLPSDPAHALASMGGGAGRGVRRNRRVAARAVLPARRREGLARNRQPRSHRRRAAASACATSRPSARSRSRARMPPCSSIGSAPTPSRRSRSARRAMRCCCARTAS